MRLKFRVTKIDDDMFFLKKGNIFYFDLAEERIYSEDLKQYMPVEMALKLGLDGVRVE